MALTRLTTAKRGEDKGDFMKEEHITFVKFLPNSAWRLYISCGEGNEDRAYKFELWRNGEGQTITMNEEDLKGLLAAVKEIEPKLYERGLL